MRDMRHAAKRLGDREKRLVREQKKYQEAEGLQKTAQMLTSSGIKMDEHDDFVKVADYVGEKLQTVDEELDARIRLRENMKSMVKQYKESGSGKIVGAAQMV